MPLVTAIGSTVLLEASLALRLLVKPSRRLALIFHRDSLRESWLRRLALAVTAAGGILVAIGITLFVWEGALRSLPADIYKSAFTSYPIVALGATLLVEGSNLMRIQSAAT